MQDFIAVKVSVAAVDVVVVVVADVDVCKKDIKYKWNFHKNCATCFLRSKRFGVKPESQLGRESEMIFIIYATQYLSTFLLWNLLM